jgi:hypothetical protein
MFNKELFILVLCILLIKKNKINVPIRSWIEKAKLDVLKKITSLSII